MSDFDILNSGNRKSFLSTIDKRKKLGLEDSDSSEDEDLGGRKKCQKHVHEDPRLKALTQHIIDRKLPQQSTSEPVNIAPKLENNINIPSSNISTLASTMEELYPPTPSREPQSPPLPTALSEAQTLTLLSDEEKEDIIEDIPDTGIEDLDPDLAAFLKESKTLAEEPQKITIKLQYVVPTQNMNPAIASIVEKLVKPMKVIVMNDEQFDKILTIFCNHKKLKKSDVVMSYKEDKIFLRGTPAGVGMHGPETHTMYIYKAHSWDEKLMKEEQMKSELRSRLNHSEEDTNDLNIPVEEDKMILKLRGSDKKEISLRVKPSTLLSSITEKYKIITESDQNIQLYFEGEALNPDSTIADTDLETEDLLEVIVKK